MRQSDRGSMHKSVHACTGTCKAYCMALAGNIIHIHPSAQIMEVVHGWGGRSKFQTIENSLKGLFHESTKINKINHQCIQIRRRSLHTNWHRLMDIGTALADDLTSISYLFARRSCLFVKKVQYNIGMN